MDLKEAIDICLNFYALESQKIQAFSFIEGYKSNGNWEPIWNIFSTTTDDQIRFICLQILEGIVACQSFNHDFTVMGRNLIEFFSPNEKSFITGKIVQILVEIFIDHYVKNKWPSFFHDLAQNVKSSSPSSPSSFSISPLASLSSSTPSSPPSSPRSLLLLLRVCLGINEIIGTKESQHSNRKRNSIIKEALKSKDLVNLVNLWIENLYMNQNVDLVLKCLTGFIIWVDTSLMIRQDILERVYNHLTNEEYRQSAIQFLIALVSKGMAIDEKFKLINYLNLNSMFMQFNPQSSSPCYSRENANANENNTLNNLFNVELFKLINATGISLLSTDLKDSQNKNEIWSFLLDGITANAIRICSNGMSKNVLHLCPYFTSLCTFLKGGERKGKSLSMQENHLLEQLIQIVIINMKLPFENNSSMALFSDCEMPEDINESRKQLELILEHLLHLIPQSSMARMENYIIEVLNNISIASPSDLELILTLTRHYGDASKDVELMTNITSPSPSHSPSMTPTRFGMIIQKILDCTEYIKMYTLLSSAFLECCIKYSNREDGLFKAFPNYRQSVFKVIFYQLENDKKENHDKHFISILLRLIKSLKNQIKRESVIGEREGMGMEIKLEGGKDVFFSESISSICFNLAIPSLKNENYLDLMEIVGMLIAQRIDLVERYFGFLFELLSSFSSFTSSLSLSIGNDQRDNRIQFNRLKLSIMSIGALLKGIEEFKSSDEISKNVNSLIIQSFSFVPYASPSFFVEFLMEKRKNQRTRQGQGGVEGEISLIYIEILESTIYTLQRIVNFAPEFVLSQLSSLFEFVCNFSSSSSSSSFNGKTSAMMNYLTIMNNFLNLLIFRLGGKKSSNNILNEKYFLFYLQAILEIMKSPQINGTDDSIQLMEMEKSTIILIISTFSSNPTIFSSLQNFNNNMITGNQSVNGNNFNINRMGNGSNLSPFPDHLQSSLSIYEIIMKILEISIATNKQNAPLIQKTIILLEILVDHLYKEGMGMGIEVKGNYVYEFNSWFKRMVSMIIEIILENSIFDQNLFNEFSGLMQQSLQSSSNLNVQEDFFNIAKQMGYLPLPNDKLAEFISTAHMLEKKMYKTFLQTAKQIESEIRRLEEKQERLESSLENFHSANIKKGGNENIPRMTMTSDNSSLLVMESVPVSTLISSPLITIDAAIEPGALEESILRRQENLNNEQKAIGRGFSLEDSSSFQVTSPKILGLIGIPIVSHEMGPYSPPTELPSEGGYDLPKPEKIISSGMELNASVSSSPLSMQSSLFNDPESVFALPIIQTKDESSKMAANETREKGNGNEMANEELKQERKDPIREDEMIRLKYGVSKVDMQGNIVPIVIPREEKSFYKSASVFDYFTEGDSFDEWGKSNSSARQIMFVMNDMISNFEMEKIFCCVREKLKHFMQGHIYVLYFSQKLDSSLFTNFSPLVKKENVNEEGERNDNDGSGGDYSTAGNAASLPLSFDNAGLVSDDESFKVNSGQSIVDQFVNVYSKWFPNWTLRIVKIGADGDLKTFQRLLEMEWKRFNEKNSPIMMILNDVQNNVDEWIVGNCPGSVLIVK